VTTGDDVDGTPVEALSVDDGRDECVGLGVWLDVGVDDLVGSGVLVELLVARGVLLSTGVGAGVGATVAGGGRTNR
jgi:hypothetical protein